MQETVIKIENLKKQYRLGTIGGGTLRADLQSWWARRHGKEDPNTKIGTDMSTVGDTFYALNGINLEVHKGEALGIIGANGAGKSTLLKLLSRVTAPTEGTIKMNGRIASMLEVGTGFHPELTGRENIYMNGAILGMTKAEIDSKIEKIIDFSECRQFIDTPVKRYSSGMYVKLAFSVAAHLDAEIMIMDEVLAVGDIKFQQKCLGKMGDAADNEGKTVLYVSHNMSTIRQLCSRCIVLDRGKIVFDGEVEKAIEVYINSDKIDYPILYELDAVKRPSLDHGKAIHIDSFEFLGCEKAQFIEGTKPCVRVTWHGNSRVEGVKIYSTIKTDDEKCVGTIVTEELCDSIEGEVITVRYTLDFSMLSPGRYNFLINAITQNSFGTATSYDRPDRKIFFEILPNNEKNRFEWKASYMGNIVFPVAKKNEE